MNPTDAFRKEQRKREIQRNKLERKYLRDANSKKETPEELRSELQDLISKEQNAGPLTKMERLRKRVLQDAYDAALKKRKVKYCLPQYCTADTEHVWGSPERISLNVFSDSSCVGAVCPLEK